MELKFPAISATQINALPMRAVLTLANLCETLAIAHGDSMNEADRKRLALATARISRRRTREKRAFAKSLSYKTRYPKVRGNVADWSEYFNALQTRRGTMTDDEMAALRDLHTELAAEPPVIYTRSNT